MSVFNTVLAMGISAILSSPGIWSELRELRVSSARIEVATQSARFKAADAGCKSNSSRRRGYVHLDTLPHRRGHQPYRSLHGRGLKAVPLITSP